MAYVAAASLKRVLGDFRPDPYVIQLFKLADSIQTFDFEGNRLEEEIRDALRRAEDVIESFILSRLLSPEDINEGSGDSSQTSNFSTFFKNVKEVIQEIESTKERMDQLAEDLKLGKENYNPSTDDLPPRHKNKMVGIDADLNQMKKGLFGEGNPRRYLQLRAFEIHGMGGTGKTSLAISIYNDLDVRRHFSVGAWIKLSVQFSVRNILLDLWHSIEFFGDGRVKDINNSIIIEEMDDEELANLVRGFLMVERYLVIVDCLCDINLSSWDCIKTLLPDSNNESRILLVSRWRFDSDDKFIVGFFKKSLLDASQSWNLLEQQVFDNKPCSDRVLEKIGKRIAEKCEGLPIAIITVGVHLAREEKKVEYWNKILESGNSRAYVADGASMFEQIGLSYKHMPQRWRPIFLYMAAFQENHQFFLLEIIRLWVAEALLEYEFTELFEYLAPRHLIKNYWLANIEICTWSIHHALWHFCCHQAKKEEFFHIFDEYIDACEDSCISSKIWRLVIRNTVLFGITEFVGKIKHSELSIRSMLFTGAYHPYPLTGVLWGNYKMLRVLNASSIRFYEFPPEILYLRLLEYLALTLNGGNLPPGIYKLRNLETLIVHFYHTVRSCEGDPSYLPIEIWKMRRLAHLQVMGCDLPAPPHSDSLLPKLSSLLDVSPRSCTKEILERIPNLKTVKIRINFTPKRDPNPVYFFNHNMGLAKVHSASFVVTNPYFEENTGSQVVAIPESFTLSMGNVKILSLSGCGFTWESIEPISQLPGLLVLELRGHAFRGPKWELTNTGFNMLKHLLLEDLDLVYWTTRTGDRFFPRLRRIDILRCFKLEQFPTSFAHCPNLSKIVVIDSSRATEIWAKSMHVEMSKSGKMNLTVTSPRGQPVVNYILTPKLRPSMN